MAMKQTAVEWLEEQMKTWGNLPRWQRDEIIEQAKEMEKEQMMQCYEDGYNRVVKLIEDATQRNLNL
jgi:hypothetical protein